MHPLAWAQLAWCYEVGVFICVCVCECMYLYGRTYVRRLRISDPQSVTFFHLFSDQYVDPLAIILCYCYCY